ncbi:MAG: putative tRNA threonylcarbamoyladenosine biosynthesis protein Gcp [Candidatus Beckwithbacteria bacterium GW2011_GWA2_43_10]|uniref:tRNA N6-adenosine threonylcarbamoyltransferase n=1 Tax=Candidatus Beckwithbacteria bacterium GW2011_GWA2_43_10 TaxID=1618369 RepID=A0A0G1C2L7_9BACT|nr:MAG: putative tRNA threonylcarbamoyladenosine biosynthesis protein Gcp [Candidatus Beckwithbacteria bacterium GW2011_GWA2_43_10]
MRILAIETSCDETAISILEGKSNPENSSFKILSNIVSSQVKIHAKRGGVVPNLAKREHQRNLVTVLKKALSESKLLKIQSFPSRANPPLAEKIKNLEIILEREPELFKKLIPFLNKHKKPRIDLIAVTNGPGLEPALWVGINFAKALAIFWNKPIIRINHMEGHLISPFLKFSEIAPPKIPAVALLVSGGHTELILVKKWMKYELLGQTRDDAAGEAFDKVAKMLGLGYPGGPIISKLAKNFKHPDIGCRYDIRCPQIKLPRPMISSKDYDFSFSGLKTAVLYFIQKLSEKQLKELTPAICAEFQQAVVDVLVQKTIRAAKEYRAKTIIVGGGVIANETLREKLTQESSKNGFSIALPEIKFTGDNAAMIGLAAFMREKTKKKKSLAITEKNLEANGNLKLA